MDQLGQAQLSDLSHLVGTQVVINKVIYDKYSVPGDGNCLFHALSLSLFGNLQYSALYRQVIGNYILTNWTEWKEKVAFAHDEQMARPDVYMQKMLLEEAWAASCEIEAASVLFHCCICIWLKDNKSGRFTDHSFNVNNPSFVIDLHLRSQHFEVLRKSRPITQNSVSETRVRDFAESLSDHTYSSNVKNNSNSSISGSSVVSPHTASHDHVHVQSDIITKEKSFSDRPYARSFQGEQVTSSRKRPHSTLSDSVPSHKTHVENIKTKSTVKRPAVSIPAKPVEKVLSTCDSKESICRRLGVHFEPPIQNETKSDKRNRNRRNSHRINRQREKNVDISDIPVAPPLSTDEQFNSAMDAIRGFEMEQLSYSFSCCSVCHERRIDTNKCDAGLCKRCKNDKGPIKLFSVENNMSPGNVPPALEELSIVEQQLICRISPCINIHMLKHGGIASSGHCVTFPQEINEPAQIFPRLPHEVNIIKVRKQGKNHTSKEFIVRRYKVEGALRWLKTNNPAYTDIVICQERLLMLPVDGELNNIHTVEYDDNVNHQNDKGPAPQQTEVEVDDGESYSSVLLPDKPVNIRAKIQNIVKEVVGSEAVTVNRRGTFTIPWPTSGDAPVSEFTTQYFFSLAFPALFPHGVGDFFINRPRTCSSMSDWAEHLLWYQDARFAKHPYFKFVVHNMLMRKRALENSTYIIQQRIGEDHITIAGMKDLLEKGDLSLLKKIMYFSGSLRGTTQYWSQKGKELRALIKFKIQEESGLPSFFTTGSCAEFHFKPLKRLLQLYIHDTTNKKTDLSNRSEMFKALQENTHIVAKYFDLRTQSFFQKVMGPVFNVDSYWYRQEFAKSRGMIHWHGLCWRGDREPHDLLHNAVQDGLTDSECAQRLSDWARIQLGMSALHPAGKDDHDQPRKNLWPPPEGTAPAPPEEKNPLVKLLMDVSSSEESLLEDYLLLTNRVSIHRCSDYCLRQKNSGPKTCRMEFGSKNSPGKLIRSTPEIVKDRNGSMRLEMERDHPMLVQNSRYLTQGWRANADMSVILSKNGSKNPSVNEILGPEKYITRYACKGNAPTGAVADLFQDLVNCADSTTAATGKAVVTKLLMNTVKRDVSAVEASYELSSLPLYRSSHTFQSLSLSGSRVLECSGSTATKNTPLDRYLSRDRNDKSSLYGYVCKTGKVPVIAGSFSQPSWPLNEEYSRTMLILHWPDWRTIRDIKDEDSTWPQKLTSFLESEECPNFLRADIERARKHHSDYSEDDAVSENDEDERDGEPEWMQLVRPPAKFSDNEQFMTSTFDDGGPECDWSVPLGITSYPSDMGLKWVAQLSENLSSADRDVEIPEIDIAKMNKEQLLAFNIVLR